ncbi:hypothetical protein [Microcoleus sp. B4-D4]
MGIGNWELGIGNWELTTRYSRAIFVGAISPTIFDEYRKLI